MPPLAQRAQAAPVLLPRAWARAPVVRWHQAAYDPISGDTLCHIDFKFEDGSRQVGIEIYGILGERLNDS